MKYQNTNIILPQVKEVESYKSRQAGASVWPVLCIDEFRCQGQGSTQGVESNNLKGLHH